MQAFSIISAKPLFRTSQQRQAMSKTSVASTTDATTSDVHFPINQDGKQIKAVSNVKFLKCGKGQMQHHVDGLSPADPASNPSPIPGPNVTTN
jgi:hypothetical protein